MSDSRYALAPPRYLIGYVEPGYSYWPVEFPGGGSLTSLVLAMNETFTDYEMNVLHLWEAWIRPGVCSNKWPEPSYSRYNYILHKRWDMTASVDKSVSAGVLFLLIIHKTLREHRLCLFWLHWGSLKTLLNVPIRYIWFNAALWIKYRKHSHTIPGWSYGSYGKVRLSHKICTSPHSPYKVMSATVRSFIENLSKLSALICLPADPTQLHQMTESLLNTILAHRSATYLIM